MKKKYLILSVFLSIIFIFQGYEYLNKKSTFQLTLEEEVWLSEFFRDVFLEESAIYTLWGTKPLTAFDICYYTKDELQNLRHQHGVPDDKDSKVISVTRYTIPENWDKWEQIRSRFPIKNFLFFKKQDNFFPKIYRLYFVNIRLLEATLTDHYKLFKERIEADFKPCNVVLEIQDNESFFWEHVFNDSMLMGILYGFGKNNAENFLQAGKINSGIKFSDQQEVIGETDLNNFTIPIFASFSEKDEKIKQYLMERKRIKKTYKNKNFVHETLKQLMSKN